ncbi:winged helix-turn-helix domain-containing protein [Pseudomonas hunanensis]|uniref:winged helix-turn-helix domain-containing protein n=1 Tax=Pseudomonas hunanensis TaxID=1247546 RepID=UPI0035B54ED1
MDRTYSLEGVYTFGDLVLNPVSREASCGTRRIVMKATSFRILSLLIRHADQLVSRQSIFSAVWGYGFDPGTKVLEVQLSYLRRSLTALESAVQIHTHRGRGLRIQVNRSDSIPAEAVLAAVE